MRLTRNTTPDGRGKYALVRLDKLRAMEQGRSGLITDRAAKAMDELAALGLLEYGEKGSAEEFFVIKLKDKNASESLFSYAIEARLNGDNELAADVEMLARRTESHTDKHNPD